MKKNYKTKLYARETCETILCDIAAGIAISIGGTAFLITGNAWCFTIGLLLVCFFGFNLYTGKIPYFTFAPYFMNKRLTWKLNLSKIKSMFFMVCINMLTAFAMGMIVKSIRPDVIEKAEQLAEAKLNTAWWIVIIKGILCNVMIFSAVEFWKSGKVILKPLGLIFSTAIFVMCGFEHCVANAFYFGVASRFDIDAFLWLNVLGNTIGGIAAYRTVKFIEGDAE